ncbi:MAG: tRNA uridine-5-carboxymethylaminomethyl(34) synthesis GTPase MnmE [Opitutae bacterium]|nr:tRNA uridine-5-carboxymethylaminomethyl(34) synthesis GTPase MnmE [Opitutae bacterium]MBT4225694.1 tRNA uridine-5-carboxymethylaminomethyl(34) synthesis GTPase MnmE [Opitutae bacterium]MBT5379872.1 tRNA uridine-5-carboxymethylaminomethyl(34) synthesis GTPase MnmE [Opitutae bacterium]MBT5692906.1 tRNA uridine-5-carboxymethylaminomethyl(34) synthesis GTPase MnmE [Opitutae bacterium]MBT6463746.1 tRNA uridine-5-carboxymethylaminomethyl(34) synthesis GTPase MnmE [Opitutae bacterium]
MSEKHTITALATPVGESAVALVRVSGALVPQIMQEIFGRKSLPKPRQAYLGNYRNLENVVLDQALYTYFEKDGSFTGDSTLEIACHGNPLIAKKILDDLQARGCRPAEPGEFTRTAFLNQRMDLSQAEAVMELIQAKSEKALAVAQRHLRGGLGENIRTIKEPLIRLCAHLEAYIDFPEEDLPEENQEGPKRELRKILNSIGRLIETNRYHEALSQGVRLAILGAPNAGKSSLLNAILNKERAIVSDTPGTTRDFIAERITFGGLDLEIIDTAGIRDGGSEIERIGMEHSLKVAENADFYILVIDTTENPPDLPKNLIEKLTPANCLIAENKIDLQESKNFTEYIPKLSRKRISALCGKGLDELKAGLQEKLEALIELPDEETVVINTRHRILLEEGQKHLIEGQKHLAKDGPAELAAIDLRVALEKISSITGTVDTEEVLDEIFSSFCIGK